MLIIFICKLNKFGLKVLFINRWI